MSYHFSPRTVTQFVPLVALALASASALAQQAPHGIHWKNDPDSLAANPHGVAARRAAAESADKAAAKAVTDSSFTTQATSAKTLTYYGGPVMKNVKVVQVIYGGGTYPSYVSGTGAGTMAAFYKAIVGSPYFTWLNGDYGTGSGQTSQTIGTGTYGGYYTITPSSSRNGSTITDAQIQSELKAQIAAGHLPAPNSNTYYSVHFPKGKTISQGGSNSCVSGGFCAYHGTVTSSATTSGYWTYGVLPDNSSGSGCDVGCGNSTAYNNWNSVASHELIETVTDLAVGVATSYASPLAWYNQTYGEIGDICNANQGTVVGTDGVTYTVQKEWSNSKQTCRSQ